jgi:hypothetical protein
MSRIKRRDFVTLASGMAAWPLAARAQQRVMPVIGFLGTTSPSAWRQPVAAFEDRLRELGWIMGRTIAIDYRWTEGRNEQAPAIAEAFVQRKVDVIVVGGNAVSAAKQATASIPIVFPVAIDPLGSGFVDSLARPGGNVTGLSLQGADSCSCCARSCRGYADWRSWPMSAIPRPKKSWRSVRRPPARLASKRPQWSSEGSRISLPPSIRSTAMSRRCMS